MSDLYSLLEALRQPSIDSAFVGFLGREINIHVGIREKASTSQKNLREILRNKSNTDSNFPAVLSNADADFIGGSFGRETKIKPLDDIDLYIPLDGQGLQYLQGGIHQPYIVLTDNSYTSSNPVLSADWADGGYVSSAKLISNFTKVLQKSYPDSKVRADQQAINVQLTIGQSESSDGVAFDVVPCFSLKPDSLGQSFYFIPDGKNGWLRTNPKIDTDTANALNNANAKTFKKVVRLIKYWSIAKGCDFGSYYIELAIARAYLYQNNSGSSVTSISEGVALGFNALSNAVTFGDQASWVQGALPVKPKEITLLVASSVHLAATQARIARQQEQAGRNYDAINTWAGIFGPTFSN